jgi:ATP-dependent Lhr-like helicase
MWTRSKAGLSVRNPRRKVIPPPAAAPALQVATRGDTWFASRGWTPFAFQREVWAAMAEGKSGLLHATTGSGKTYAVWMGALARSPAEASGLGVLWLTPMRALAADTRRALELPLPEMAPQWSVGLRTGDTSASERAKQDRKLPTTLVTTPESATLLLTRADARERLSGVHTVIVDEWHEMVGNKRGVQVQLVLARLKRWNPQLVVWGLSATLGNLADAMQMLLGYRCPQATDPSPPAPEGVGSSGKATLTQDDGVLVQGKIEKPLVVDTLLPREPGRFSWGGHLGAQMEEPVVHEIETSGTTLVFTNVRSQAEIWYQMLLRSRPEWAGQIALHHGSLDKDVRAWVEQGLKARALKAVVATSRSTGRGLLPVERVLQISSPAGAAAAAGRPLGSSAGSDCA